MLSENYTVVLVEEDFYALHAINSYLAWDRRTRVTHMLSTLDQLIALLVDTPLAEQPSTILLDTALFRSPEYAGAAIKRIGDLCKSDVIVMAHKAQEPIARAVHSAGARGYVVREDVGLQVSWMICWAKNYEFIVTPMSAALFPDAKVLPDGREYPELTDRVRQALMLCVVEGMSAELAADEMGLSPHTIRTYIKEGYNILEAHDDNDFPAELSPQERAFMRFTALSMEEQEDE